MIILFLLPLFFMPVVILVAILLVFYFQKNSNGNEYKTSTQIPKYQQCSKGADKGQYGEYLTYKYLKHFESNGAKFLFNVYVPKGDGETTEIDLLMICSKGIFVFESKNYSGWIFGKECKKTWYQTLPTGSRKSEKIEFYNPIMQNWAHIKHLKNFIGDHFPIHSIVVFSERCTLKNVQVDSDNVKVINRYHVNSVVSSICDKTSTVLLSDRDIEEIYGKLYPFTQLDTNIKKQHILNIQDKLSRGNVRSCDAVSRKEICDESQIVIKDGQSHNPIKNETAKQQIIKCPKCNGTLVLRTATKGNYAGKQFYGCSNYPRCRYIQNITTKKI